MVLDRSRAEVAIAKDVANPLGVSAQRAAAGINSVVNDNMARAAKVHCLERGRDPREYTMVAFGGAGPVHAYSVAMELGITRILFPARAGVMSAFGFLVSPPAFELLRTVAVSIYDVDLAATRELFEEMEAEGRRMLEGAGIAAQDIGVRREAAVRYYGQTFDLLVPMSSSQIEDMHLRQLEAAFLERYQARYHRTNPGHRIEVVNWRVVVGGPRPDVRLEKFPPSNGKKLPLKGYRQVYMSDTDGFVTCPVYDRYRLGSGASISGPAIIEEVESTVVVGSAGKVQADEHNNLLLTIVTN